MGVLFPFFDIIPWVTSPAGQWPGDISAVTGALSTSAG